MNSQDIIRDLSALLSSDDHPITTLANSAAFIFDTIPDLNWAGYYLYDGTELYLGPFAGKPACTKIPMGKGVCGTSAEKRETIVVEDVHKFEGHIACDSASNSEIVVPMIKKDGSLYGVLDIDSPSFNRFTDAEKNIFEAIRDTVIKVIE
ncbi:MAG TPA: GAF domain-containing protein [Candidatus Kapabacteria bacterium]|nr:GAF domain-containing protein [Candidatus Kapabacteria bacterium]